MDIVSYINDYFGTEVNTVSEFLKDFEYDYEGDSDDLYVNLANLLRYVERQEK